MMPDLGQAGELTETETETETLLLGQHLPLPGSPLAGEDISKQCRK